MLCVAYPFFITLQRSLWEYQGQGGSSIRGQFRALTVWFTGSFCSEEKISIYKKIRKLKIRPEGGEKQVGRQLTIKESFPRKKCRKISFSFGSFRGKMNHVCMDKHKFNIILPRR